MLEMVKRWRWALLIAAILVAGLAYAFWPERVAVDTATVSRGPMAVSITDDGVTRARELYVVSATVTGYLSRIDLNVGDRVSRGALIASITARPAAPLDERSLRELRAALSGSEAARMGAAAARDQARRDLVRAQELASRGFLPRTQLEATQTRVAAAEAALAEAQAQLARIRAQGATPTGLAGPGGIALRAPATGSVLSLIKESAGVVAEGTEIVAIGDPRAIEVVVDLLSREAVRVKPGDRVEIVQWGGDSPLSGRVERIEPFGRLKVSALGIEEQRVNVIVSLDPASAAKAMRLGHGYQVDARIVLWSRADALRVPIGALFRDGASQWCVFAVKNGRARATPVKIGHLNDEFGEVLAGLSAGDTVILNPGSMLSDGTRITPR